MIAVAEDVNVVGAVDLGGLDLRPLLLLRQRSCCKSDRDQGGRHAYKTNPRHVIPPFASRAANSLSRCGPDVRIIQRLITCHVTCCLKPTPARAFILPIVPSLKPAASSRTGKKRQCHQVGRDGEPDLNDATVSDDGFTVDKTDLYVVVLEKRLIERIDSLVDSLLGGEQQAGLKRIIADLLPLLRGSDQIHQFR